MTGLVFVVVVGGGGTTMATVSQTTLSRRIIETRDTEITFD